MACRICGERGHTTNLHFKLVNKIKDTGYPTHEPKYKIAHEEASAAEKARYPQGYEELKHLDRSAGHKHELIGTNKPDGTVEVSSEVPRPLRNEVAYHERTENKILRNKE